MHDIVQRASFGFSKRIACQRIGGRVHVDAVLALIHDEYGDGGIFQDRIEPPRRVAQTRLGLLSVGDVEHEFETGAVG